MTTTANIEELDLENTVETDEDDTSTEVLDHEGDDEAAPGHEDHLSEAIIERIRAYVPNHTQYAGEAGNGYVECLTEQPEQLTDDTWITKVGVALVDEEQSGKAHALCGTITEQFVGDGQLFELGYRYIEDGEAPGFLYSLTLNGRYVKGFRNIALAHLAYDILVDHQPKRFDFILANLISIFHTQGVRMGEDQLERCSEDFVQLVNHLTQEYMA
jgi:hypothetical protein